jgi:hypothetical protein
VGRARRGEATTAGGVPRRAPLMAFVSTMKRWGNDWGMGGKAAGVTSTSGRRRGGWGGGDVPALGHKVVAAACSGKEKGGCGAGSG